MTKFSDRPLVVLDKSFLYGASASQLEALGSSYRVVVSDALVLELLTTGAKDRCKCAERLKNVVREFLIVESIPALLRYELASHRPCMPVTERVQSRLAGVGNRMGRWRLVLRAQEVVLIQTWRADVEEAAQYFLDEAETIPRIFRELGAAKAHERKAHALDLQKRLAEDPGPIRELCTAMHEERFPQADELDESWALFRRTQVHMFAALEEFGRHGYEVNQVEPSAKAKEELGREVVDFDYRILGLMVGGLATLDKPGAATFRALSRGGILLDRDWDPTQDPPEVVT